MTYVTRLLVSDRNGIEAAVSDYLTAQSPSTIHAIVPFCRGSKIYVLIVTE